MSAAFVRGLMRRARSAVLATSLSTENGWPYASLVTVAVDGDASPILLLSDLADHTRNLALDARAALLFERASRLANPQAGPRLTVLGRIERSDVERHRARFLAHHPAAAAYAGFADFQVYRMHVERARYTGGFAEARWIQAVDLLFDPKAADAIAACEETVVRHMNTDHAETIDLYTNRLLDRKGEGWRLVAVDPEGCEMTCGAARARLDFPEAATDAVALRRTLIALAHEARTRRP